MTFPTPIPSPPRRPRTAVLESTLVRDVMHPGVLTCPLDTPLRDVARMMARHRIHAVVVFGGDEAPFGTNGLLWGVVSDLDLVSEAAAGDVDALSAGQMAVTPVVTVATDDPLARAAQLMREHEIAHLIVVDRGSTHPVGVLSTLDVAAALAAGD